jgi:putative PIN family toxin of toxin-antitoxin system
MSDAWRPTSAVVDLNLFVSGLISPLGRPYQIIERLRYGAFTLVISRQIREELDVVLHRDKFTVKLGLTADVIDAFLFLVDAQASFVEPSQQLPVAVRDPKDAIILATAIDGRADFLVTGDMDLLVLRDDPAVGSLQIVTAREFLTALAASS